MTHHTLPPELPDRSVLHNEVHARPPIGISLPARVLYIAVETAQVSREEERQHLQRLPSQAGLTAEDLSTNFWLGTFGDCTITWERHTEFSRYVLIQPLSESIDVTAPPFADFGACPMSEDWRSAIPGEVFCAIDMILAPGDLSDPNAALRSARTWWGDKPVVASLIGHGSHSLAVTDLRIGLDGFEQILVVTSPTADTQRVGRVASRLLDLETYRLMALRGLPAAKSLTPLVQSSEAELAHLTAAMQERRASDRELLESLVGLASGIEHASSAHTYRFSATAAYNTLVEQRLGELREQAVAGTVTIGDFLRRRFSPATATVASTANRLQSLSERIGHTSALLRTRVDIAGEEQNRQLLAKLTRGQDMQLRLQATVEGLSIAAVSYYLVGLINLVAKGAHAAGMPVNPELVAGASVPFVMFGVWMLIRRIHRRLQVE